jgi:preprotein translocase subunit SecB
MTLTTNRVSLLNHVGKGEFKLNPVFCKKTEIDESGHVRIALQMVIKNTEVTPFPIDLNVVFTGDFQIAEYQLADEDFQDFAHYKAVQILVPHLRALVTSVTAASFLTPLLLPIMDVRMFREVESLIQ